MKTKSKLMAMLSIVAVVFIAAMAQAQATYVSLVPDTLSVEPGSMVNVSVDISVDSPGFDMSAISVAILYDPAVFTYVDPVVQGAFLQHDWSGGMPLGTATTAGEFRIGGIDWTDMMNGEHLAAGVGTLFTFTLLANAGAPLGLSALSWGDSSGTGSGPVGFDYGDLDGLDVVLPSYGAWINVVPVPEPSSTVIVGALLLLRFGARTLRILRRKFLA